MAGMVFTMAAGVCYALGSQSRFAWSLEPASEANAWLLIAGVMLLIASACDMLDGAVARIGNRATPFGAFLDSTLDRFSDFVVYAGIAASYAWSRPANITFILLSMAAFFNAFMISYTRARAEDLIESCKVGFMQRGERSAAILIATFAYNIPALVLQQSILTIGTVLRRMQYTKAVLEGKNPITDPRKGNIIHKLCLWSWPRMSLPYDIVVTINIAWLLLARFTPTDYLRELIG